MNLTGPCNWPTSGCPACSPDGLDCLTSTVRTEVIAWATNDLWEATGRVYGTCEVTVYPCNDYSTICGSCNNAYRSCGCVSVDEVKLAGPVESIASVVVDGVTLDDTAYRVDDWQWLVRLDGGTWPANADPTNPTSFAVTYALGEAPPAGAGIVTGILACERAKALCGDTTCRLPARTRQVARQGVTMIWADADGGFGLPEVDEWVRNANTPGHAGAVHSPDLPTVRQTTWVATP